MQLKTKPDAIGDLTVSTDTLHLRCTMVKNGSHFTVKADTQLNIPHNCSIRSTDRWLGRAGNTVFRSVERENGDIKHTVGAAKQPCGMSNKHQMLPVTLIADRNAGLLSIIGPLEQAGVTWNIITKVNGKEDNRSLTTIINALGHLNIDPSQTTGHVLSPVTQHNFYRKPTQLPVQVGNNCRSLLISSKKVNQLDRQPLVPEYFLLASLLTLTTNLVMPAAHRSPCSYSYTELVALPFSPYKLEGLGSLYFPLHGTATSDINVFLDGTALTQAQFDALQIKCRHTAKFEQRFREYRACSSNGPHDHAVIFWARCCAPERQCTGMQILLIFRFLTGLPPE
ncbi:hypothetical protein DFH08DRAFT_824102 [Mycena albidolilacea]|uniref:Uncharacterized protein n=1 Tax=Mycena albidolilacea TaxID=1033008 RepID=A0AAD6Z5C8_9AGAR|nr:hypothetical protein DFH08DRAFT_824102 [Mycena albidolilacea]